MNEKVIRAGTSNCVRQGVIASKKVIHRALGSCSVASAARHRAPAAHCRYESPNDGYEMLIGRRYCCVSPSTPLSPTALSLRQTFLSPSSA